MFCPNCGANVPDGTQFCTSCGATLSAAPQSAPVPQTAPKNTKHTIALVAVILAAVTVISLFLPFMSAFGQSVSGMDLLDSALNSGDGDAMIYVISSVCAAVALIAALLALKKPKFAILTIIAAVISAGLMYLMINSYMGEYMREYMGIGFTLYLLGNLGAAVASIVALAKK